jgi:virginiamycin B lyase
LKPRARWFIIRSTQQHGVLTQTEESDDRARGQLGTGHPRECRTRLRDRIGWSGVDQRVGDAQRAPARGEVVAPIPIPAGGGEIALGSSGVWATSWPTSTLQRIDPATNAVAARMTVKPQKPCPAAPGACGGLAVGNGAVWVALLTDNVVIRVDPKTRRATARIPVGPQPDGLATSAGAIWVANNGGPSVSRIDPKTNKVVATIRVGSAQACCDDHMAVTWGGGAVWATVTKLGAVVRIDPRTNKVVKTIRLSWLRSGKPCGYLAASTRAVWASGAHCAASTGRGGVTRIDPRANRPTKTVAGFRAPIGLALGFGSLWVADIEAKSIHRLDPRTGHRDARLGVGGIPIRLRVGFGSLWVRDDSGRVLRLQPLR